MLKVRKYLFHLSCKVWRIVISKSLNLRSLLVTHVRILQHAFPNIDHAANFNEHQAPATLTSSQVRLPLTQSANDALQLLLSKDEEKVRFVSLE